MAVASESIGLPDLLAVALITCEAYGNAGKIAWKHNLIDYSGVVLHENTRVYCLCWRPSR